MDGEPDQQMTGGRPVVGAAGIHVGKDQCSGPSVPPVDVGVGLSAEQDLKVSTSLVKHRDAFPRHSQDLGYTE